MTVRYRTARWLDIPFKSILVAIATTSLLATPTSTAQEAGNHSQTPSGIVEVIPTAQHERVSWRYTFDRPPENWSHSSFDDSGWKSGQGGFGTSMTSGLAIGTRWDTADIWLRRDAKLPGGAVDLANLQLLVFHDEDAEIFLNGVLAARLRGFVTRFENVEIAPEAAKTLKRGEKVSIAVHCHQTIGGQGIDVGLATVSPEYAAAVAVARRKERYRDAAFSRSGDVAAGQALFNDTQRLACVRCHTNDGKGGRPGPDLATIGDKFPRPDLIDAILNPSATIAVGYDTTIVRLKSGRVVEGIVKDATADQLHLMTADGTTIDVQSSKIQARRSSDVSMMPEGLEASLSEREFADLVAYLGSLRLPETAAAHRQGMPATIPELETPVTLVPLHSPELRFIRPDWVGQVPGKAGWLLVCEHETGRVWMLDVSKPQPAKSLWGDFGAEVRAGGASGLLGLAFHPQFAQNRKYYIQHEIVESGRLYALVSEKIAADDLRRDSGRTSRTIIQFECSTGDHVGGGIEFGPDGKLYIGMGDTGPQRDPQGHGQDMRLALGKILRIDVDHANGGRAYSIPADNPFIGRGGARPEIWAVGFREPWRFSFDSVGGDLWVGDVGQDRIEEVDIVRRGENYGWNVYEGFEPFSNSHRTEGARYVPPVFAYDRRYGNSITGGYVYRGDERSSFYGVYICGDYNSKRIWGIKQVDRKLTNIRQLAVSPELVASFGRDEAGRLYVVGYDGTIFRLDFGSANFEKVKADRK